MTYAGSCRKMLRFRWISLLLLLALFLYTLDYPAYGVSFPSTGHPAGVKTCMPIPSDVTSAAFVIPETLGNVIERYHGKKKKTVILIQDLHCNLLAQSNIEKILTFINKDEDGMLLNNVLVEGASGRIDTSIVSSISEKEIREYIAHYLFKEGLISGAELFILIQPDEISFSGVEDGSLYFENVTYFRKVMENRSQIDEDLQKIGNALEISVQAECNSRLQDMVRMLLGEDKERTNIYSMYIRAANENGIPLENYPNIACMNETCVLEEGFSPKKMYKEREDCLSALMKKLVDEDVKKLLVKGLKYRTGTVSGKDFYGFIRDLLKENQVDMGAYPHLEKYISIVTMLDGIDEKRLHEEVKDLEDLLIESVVKTETERVLVASLKNFKLFSDLLHLTITREDFHRFITEFPGIRSSETNSPCMVLPDNYLEKKNIKESIKSAVYFYNTLLKRDTVLVENTLGNMKREGKETVALVCGGFHTEGITKRLKEEGVSYCVVLPNGDINEGDGLYYDMLLNRRAKVADLLEQSGKRLAAMILFNNDMLREAEEENLSNDFRLLIEKLTKKALEKQKTVKENRMNASRTALEKIRRVIRKSKEYMQKKDSHTIGRVCVSVVLFFILSLPFTSVFAEDAQVDSALSESIPSDVIPVEDSESRLAVSERDVTEIEGESGFRTGIIQDISHEGDSLFTRFDIGYGQGNWDFELNAGVSRLYTNSLDSVYWERYLDNLNMISLFTGYVGNIAYAQAARAMPQYLYYTNLDFSISDFHLIFGWQWLLLPHLAGNEYNLEMLENTPYGGITYSNRWSRELGGSRHRYTGLLDLALLYQQIPKMRLFDQDALQQSRVVLDSQFEINFRHGLQLNVPLYLFLDLQGLQELGFQSLWITNHMGEMTWDDWSRYITRQATIGHGMYASMNMDDAFDALGINEEGEPGLDSTRGIRMWSPPFFVARTGIEGQFQHGRFQVSAGTGYQFMVIPRYTLRLRSSTSGLREDFDDAVGRLFLPWEAVHGVYVTAHGEYRNAHDYVFIDFFLRWNNFGRNGEFAFPQTVPLSARAGYTRTGIGNIPVVVSISVLYRNYLDGHGFAVLRDNRVEFVGELRWGSRPDEMLPEHEEDSQDTNELSDEPPVRDPDQENAPETGTVLTDAVAEPLHQKNMNGLKTAVKESFRSLKRIFKKTLILTVMTIALAVFTSCGFSQSYPYERYESVTITEETDYHEGAPLTYEFLQLEEDDDPETIEYEQSRHGDLQRGPVDSLINNNPWQMGPQIGSFVFNVNMGDLYETEVVQHGAIMRLDNVRYYSNGVPHTLIFRDRVGGEYRIPVDVSGGEDKEFKISISGIINALLRNGIYIYGLREIEIEPLSEGSLEINGFVKNPVIRFDHRPEQRRFLQNIPSEHYSEEAFDQTVGTLEPEDPFLAEEFTRYSWEQEDDSPSFSFSPADIFFPEGISVNVFSSEEYMTIRLIMAEGNEMPMRVYLAHSREGNNLSISPQLIQDYIEYTQPDEDFDSSTVAGIEFIPHPGEEGTMRVQGLYETYGQVLSGTEHNADEQTQMVTLVPAGQEWTTECTQENRSADINFVVNRMQGARNITVTEDGYIGFSHATAFEFSEEGIFSYIISQVQHDLLFEVIDDEGDSFWYKTRVTFDSENIAEAGRVVVDFAELVRDSSEWGYLPSAPLQVRAIRIVPHSQEYRELTVNAMQAFWVAVPEPYIEGTVPTYFDVDSMGVVNDSLMDMNYFAGQNPERPRETFFESYFISPYREEYTGVWFNVRGLSASPESWTLHAASEYPGAVFELLDTGENTVTCVLLGTELESQTYQIRWDPSFVFFQHALFSSGEIATASVLLDTKISKEIAGIEARISGTVAFEGISRASDYQTNPRLNAYPQETDRDVTRFDIVARGRVMRVAGAYFPGEIAEDPLSAGYTFLRLFPSWVERDGNIAGIYARLPAEEQNWEEIDDPVIRVRSLSLPTVTIELKDDENNIVEYVLRGIRPYYNTYILDLSEIRMQNPDFNLDRVTVVSVLSNADILWSPSVSLPLNGNIQIRGIFSHMQAFAIPETDSGYSEEPVIKIHDEANTTDIAAMKELVKKRTEGHSVMVAGRAVTVYADQEFLRELEMNEHEFIQMLEEILDRDKKVNGFDYSSLSDELVFVLFEKAPYLFGNCTGDGLVGLQRNLDKKIVQAGIAHELRHEARKNEDIENKQIDWDAQFLADIAPKTAVALLENLVSGQSISENHYFDQLIKKLGLLAGAEKSGAGYEMSLFQKPMEMLDTIIAIEGAGRDTHSLQKFLRIVARNCSSDAKRMQEIINSVTSAMTYKQELFSQVTVPEVVAQKMIEQYLFDLMEKVIREKSGVEGIHRYFSQSRINESPQTGKAITVLMKRLEDMFINNVSLKNLLYVLKEENTGINRSIGKNIAAMQKSVPSAVFIDISTFDEEDLRSLVKELENAKNILIVLVNHDVSDPENEQGMRWKEKLLEMFPGLKNHIITESVLLGMNESPGQAGERAVAFARAYAKEELGMKVPDEYMVFFVSELNRAFYSAFMGAMITVLGSSEGHMLTDEDRAFLKKAGVDLDAVGVDELFAEIIVSTKRRGELLRVMEETEKKG